MSAITPVDGMHRQGCLNTDCPGCWTGLAAPASDDLLTSVRTAQESNRQRMAAIEARLGRMPNFTVGMIDKLADATLGVGTEARWQFTLDWENEVARWCDATEAEIRKADLARNTPAEATQGPAGVLLGTDRFPKQKTAVIPDL